ncbi:MAG: SDR family NAD(P)-dependent oxidoreductase [Dehalococcoidia bacterium]|nr:SDR family NAD(P)-dependent oxidoreductase [Dehalococcoidia bacterium]
MDDFNGKTAVITGGASGIGLATARLLAHEGANLVLADIEEAALKEAVEEFEDAGVPVLGVRTDVGHLPQVVELADQAVEHFGGVHVLFNNAGVAISGPIVEMSHPDWEWLMRVNLWGPIHGVEAFLPRMVEQGEGGHIVNTASFAGLVANDGLGIYNVTKYGVVALSETLYREMRNEGIGVSVLCPMRVETNIGDSARNRQMEFGGPAEIEVHSELEEPEQSLAGRVIPVTEVADQVMRAIRNNELYIFTHPETRQFIRRRFDRIDRAFEE